MFAHFRVRIPAPRLHISNISKKNLDLGSDLARLVEGPIFSLRSHSTLLLKLLLWVPFLCAMLLWVLLLWVIRLLLRCYCAVSGTLWVLLPWMLLFRGCSCGCFSFESSYTVSAVALKRVACRCCMCCWRVLLFVASFDAVALCRCCGCCWNVLLL